MLVSLGLSAQNLIGATRKDVEFMAAAHGWRTCKTNLKEGQLLQVEQGDTLRFYYFRDELCTVSVIFYGGVPGSMIREMLNKNYSRNDTAWYSGNTVIKLLYDETLDGYFVKYRLVK